MLKLFPSAADPLVPLPHPSGPGAALGAGWVSGLNPSRGAAAALAQYLLPQRRRERAGAPGLGVSSVGAEPAAGPGPTPSGTTGGAQPLRRYPRAGPGAELRSHRCRCPVPAMGSPVPPPPVPPPPPPLPPALSPGARLRALHWEPVPAWRVRGRRSVWAPPPAPLPPLDLPRLRALFREPRGAAPGQRPAPAAALLEHKRSLALGVFLKQLKRPVEQIVRDIEEGVGAPYGAEKLLELSRLLPSAAEVARLGAHPGSPRQLPEPERFMVLLTRVPSYAQRLELLVLQEEFSPRLRALRGSIQTLAAAGAELMECEELHRILHLILSAGNHLNAGGYAGSAAGFRLASLLKLPDTKGNEPGMDLLHFVAMEAARMDRTLLEFPDKLRHVGLAARIDAAEVEAELRRLAARLAGARGLSAAAPFLRAAEEELRAAWRALEQQQRAAAATLDFFCEEAAAGALPALCSVLHRFALALRAAAGDNGRREQAQRRRLQLERGKRRSIASCSAPPAGPAAQRRAPLTPQPPRRGSEPAPGPAAPPPAAAAPRRGWALLHLLRRLAAGPARGAPPAEPALLPRPASPPPPAICQ
ncbi:FH2 domain-containing protein 1-like [Lathamus discolor]|uniref:FH2 domain-containing protein 1-like n=1 Tax=Lathamus discolor TaxID=678569 RepID=UPI0032B794E8